MKLQHIGTDGGHYLSRPKYGELPPAYLFIESVIACRVLSEASSNRLEAIVGAAAGKLKNLLTPGASSDLETMLSFLAPKGGGLAKVQQLVKQAGESQTDIAQDEAWWQQMFDAFGVVDQSVRQTIKAKTSQIAANKPVTGAPAQDQQQAPVPGAETVPPGASAAPTAQQPDVAALEQERAAAAQEQTGLTGQIDQNRTDQSQSRAKVAQLRAKLAALKAKGSGGVAESMLRHIAHGLLAEAEVSSNLKFVANSLMRRLGYPSSSTVQEVNWLKKFIGPPVKEGFRDFFNNLRMNYANPMYSADKWDQYGAGQNNQHLAKVAVRLLSDYITQSFQERLQVANLTPKQAMQHLVEWEKIKAAQATAIKNRQPMPPAIQARYAAAYQNMQRVVFALNPELARSPA